MNLKGLKFLYTFLYLITASIGANGQTVEWSNTQKLRGNSIFTTVIGQDESGIYVLRHRNKLLSKFIVLERYRQNLGLENSKSYLLKNTRILYSDINEAGLLLIKQVYDKKANIYKIIATSLSSNFETVIPETVLMQIKSTEWKTDPQFIIRPSFDHQNYFILNYEISNSKSHICRYTSINNRLRVNNAGEFILNSNLNIETITDIVIDKDLHYSLLAVSKRNKNDLKALTLIEQSGDTNIIKLVSDDIHSLEQPILYYNIFKDEKGISGFYTSSLQNGFEGNFSYSWKNLKLEPVLILKHPFSVSLLKEIAGETRAQSGFLPVTYQSLKVICRTDGGFIKISENAFIQKDQDIMAINGVPATQGKNIYSFENIIIQNFDSLGKPDWEGWVIKNQNTVNDGGLLGSVFISVTPSSFNILFNDPITTGGDIVLARFLHGGQREVKVVAKGDEMNAFMIPSEGKQISSDKIIVPVLKDRKFALLKITFKQ